jgi:hypothetical protein
MITKLIIVPILNKIKELLESYIIYLLKQYDNIDTNNPINIVLLENSQIAKKITISSVFRNKLIVDILKYMASKFSISTNIAELELCS